MQSRAPCNSMHTPPQRAAAPAQHDWLRVWLKGGPLYLAGCASKVGVLAMFGACAVGGTLGICLNAAGSQCTADFFQGERPFRSDWAPDVYDCWKSCGVGALLLRLCMLDLLAP